MPSICTQPPQNKSRIDCEREPIGKLCKFTDGVRKFCRLRKNTRRNDSAKNNPKKAAPTKKLKANDAVVTRNLKANAKAKIANLLKQHPAAPRNLKSAQEFDVKPIKLEAGVTKNLKANAKAKIANLLNKYPAATKAYKHDPRNPSEPRTDVPGGAWYGPPPPEKKTRKKRVKKDVIKDSSDELVEHFYVKKQLIDLELKKLIDSFNDLSKQEKYMTTKFEKKKLAEMKMHKQERIADLEKQLADINLGVESFGSGYDEPQLSDINFDGNLKMAKKAQDKYAKEADERMLADLRAQGKIGNFIQTKKEKITGPPPEAILNKMKKGAKYVPVKTDDQIKTLQTEGVRKDGKKRIQLL